MTNEELLSVAEIVERATNRLHKQAADHEAKMAEHRAAFGARTEADAKIIAGLREERDELLTQVQDMRAEMEQLRSQNRIMQQDAEDGYTEAIKVIGDPIALSKERDALRAEVAELKTQLDRLTSWAAKNQAAPHTEPVPKRAHPVAVGGYLRRLTGFNTTPAGEVARVTLVDDDDPSQLEYEVVRPNGQKGRWSAKGCEPCDPSATHDTPEGRSVAESVIRDDRKTEPADAIKVGDVVEVFQSTASCTFKTDIGMRGTVLQLDDSCVDIVLLDGFLAPKGNHVALCDVRKVTT